MTDNFAPTNNTLKSSFCLSFCAGCLVFSTSLGVLFLLEVTDTMIKWAVSMSCLVIGFLVGLVYFLYFAKRAKLMKAVRDLCYAFCKDIENLMASPADLKDLSFSARLVIVVDAVNLVRNLTVRTYKMGVRGCASRQETAKIYLRRIRESLTKLVDATKIDVRKLVLSSKDVLCVESKYSVLQ